MSRTTIRIDEEVDLGSDTPKVIFRVSEPANVPQANKFWVLDTNVSGAPFVDLAAQHDGGAQSTLVREAGLAVYNRLAVHPGVKAALERIANAAPDEACPIYLQMSTSAAEGLPFETLYLPEGRFLALDDRTPIVRVAMNDATGGVIERLCEVPIKVTAVISAAGREVYEDEEWNTLYQAFRNSQVDFRLQVLVGREGLRQQIIQAQDQRVTVERIEPDKKGLVASISKFAPVVLHFFCHGTTRPAPYLEVASRRTHDLGEDPLYLSEAEIRSLSRSLVLVTLNACEGAAPVPDAHSLALALVEKAGVPVVVGMREAIDAEDANLFTGAFYAALLDEFHRVLTNPQGEAPNWPLLLRGPRDRLASRQGGPPITAAAAHKRWSLPVVYVRPEELNLRWSGTMFQLGNLQALARSPGEDQ